MPTIVTNHHPRPVIDACELTPSERQAFDYLDWQAIDAGMDSATFVRFRGELLDLGEFTTAYGITLPGELSGWDAYAADSAFSATLLRWVDDTYESVVVGRVYC